jgi:hypothetical protein
LTTRYLGAITGLVPTVVEQTHRGERGWDVFSRLPRLGGSGQGDHAVYAKHTGQPLERSQRDLELDTFLSPEEARDYGLIDEVVTTRGG